MAPAAAAAVEVEVEVEVAVEGLGALVALVAVEEVAVGRKRP